MRVGDARFPPSRERGGVEPWPHLALFGPVYSYGRGWKWGHRGPIWHSAHSYAVGQLALVVASFGLVRSGQER